MIKLYNSLTNKIEDFKPIHEGKVMMYVCGVTVYDHAHIGNTRPVIFFDIVDRFFKYMGYEVSYVSNYTDIDDRIIKKANEENVSEQVISERYIESYKKVLKSLNCLSRAQEPKVTETIPAIISFIEELVNQGVAYVIDGDVYFDISKDDKYGILSGQSQDNLLVGVRIDENVKKHNPNDFALWKKMDEGLRWKSPWSEGRPGWHTECVVMIHEFFKEKIDIHGGGLDLKFPHHDNEIAQSYCCYHHMLANYWLHNGRLDLKGEKMSKSLGNVVWAQDLVDRIGYTAYRLLTVNVPYRQPLNYSEELVEVAIKDYEKIRRAYVYLYRKIELEHELKKIELIDNELINVKKEFIEAMSDDFNTANALTALYKLIKLINQSTRDKNATGEYLNQLLSLYQDLLWILGIDQKLECLSDSEKALIKNWNQARSNKDFAAADKYRQLIIEQGLEL